MKVIISDIHGAYYTLQDLLCDIKFNPKRDQLICLGDMCDRGKHTHKVWQYMKKLQDEYEQHVVLTGNHENMFLLAIDEAMYSQSKDNHRIKHYLRNGGLVTLQSFYPQVDENNFRQYLRKFAIEYKAYRQWLKGLRLRYEDGNFYYVHAGVDFTQTFQKQTLRDLIWIRDPFLDSKLSYDKPIVHGHTPVREAPFYQNLFNRINIDGGCVYGGVLTVLMVQNGDKKFASRPMNSKDM